MTSFVSSGVHDCDEVSSHVRRASGDERMRGCLSCSQLRDGFAGVVTMVNVQRGVSESAYNIPVNDTHRRR